MEGDRPQENRPGRLFKGLLMGVLILVALGLGVSLVGPGGAGSDPGSHPGGAVSYTHLPLPTILLV